MPSIEQNRERWRAGWQRREGGERWSRAWGGSAMHWHVGILPRLQGALPAGVIVEVGPGHGRWSRFLRPHCERLVLIDLDAGCIEACRARFRGDPGVDSRMGDGRGLQGVEDRSVDLVFSYDSLVHADTEAMQGYVQELARVLRPGGVGFLHHSNLASHRRYFARMKRLPGGLRRSLERLHLADRDGWRAEDVDARWVRDAAAGAGLAVVSQELIPWRTRRPIDCLSILRNERTRYPPRILTNRRFADEARIARRLATLYPTPATENCSSWALAEPRLGTPPRKLPLG